MAVVIMLAFAAKPVRMIARTATTQAESAASPSNTDAASAKPDQKEEEDADENDPYKKSANVTMFGKWFKLETGTASVIFWFINFAILAGALGWGLLKALPKMFRTRGEGIQKQLVDARTATEQANARLAEVEKKLAKLDEEIAAISKNSEADIAAEEARMKSALEAEKHRIVAASEQEIASATVLAQRQIRQMAAELAVDHAIKQINVTGKTEKLMVEEFAETIGHGKKRSAGGNN
jgi:F-type H+-transporting ATPase subunit b